MNSPEPLGTGLPMLPAVGLCQPTELRCGLLPAPGVLLGPALRGSACGLCAGGSKVGGGWFGVPYICGCDVSEGRGPLLVTLPFGMPP